ncbi:MAG TPA: DUF58 domain-containing protein [Acidimicrobiales bacterium]|nr:DUF58 domain-containing protein [Acidimicrobiales bacterium]
MSGPSFPRPTLRVVGALCVAAGVVAALRLAPAAAAAIALGIVGCVAADAIAARRAAVAVDVDVAQTLALGASVPITVAVDTAARVVRLRQPVPPELRVEPAEVSAGGLRGVLVGRHRGTHELAGAVVRLAGPLGLATVDRTSVHAATIRVLPDLPRARLLAMRRRGRGAEGAAVRRMGIGTEFESIREYDENDDVRFVNWMATSRCARPMTNQYRIDENRDLVCLIDTGRLMCAPVGALTRLDVALDALCVLGVAADEAGDRVGATAFAAGVTRSVAPRRRGTAHVVEALFDVEPTEVESDFSLAFQQVASKKRSIVVVFTDLADPAAARTILDAVPIVARRHEVIVATALDEDLVRAATSMPEDYHDVLRASVALELLDAHRTAVRQATSLGAQVVEASPAQLGPALVTAYVRLKSLARV